MATAEFVFNNKIHTATKLLLFKVNYGWELRLSFEIRKKRKYTKIEEFVKEIKVVLTKLQKEMKKYMDRNRKKAVEYKVGDKVLLSTKDLMWQIRNKETKKLMEKFVKSYRIKKIISENAVELELLVSMKIHPVVNISRIALYQE